MLADPSIRLKVDLNFLEYLSRFESRIDPQNWYAVDTVCFAQKTGHRGFWPALIMANFSDDELWVKHFSEGEFNTVSRVS